MDYEVIEEHVTLGPDGSYSAVGVAVSSPSRGDRPEQGSWCFFCDEGPATTFFPLDEAKLIGFGGRGFTLGGPLATCSPCAARFVDGDDRELLEQQRTRELARWASIDDAPITAKDEQGLLEETSAVLAAFHNAAGEPVRLRA